MRSRLVGCWRYLLMPMLLALLSLSCTDSKPNSALSGHWLATFVSEAGREDVDLVLTQKGDVITGFASNPRGDFRCFFEESGLSGVIKNGRLEASIARGILHIKLKGEVRDGQIRARYSVVSSGACIDEHEGEFSAVRQG